ncbi:MAG TPA: DUF6600 domain-containing protein [Thermodesulfovibrionales bacterium]|nr:DUF6600 domain-containing protein [Thermodesulfovibrionales bacterium]
MKPLRGVFLVMIFSLILFFPANSQAAIGDLRVSYLEGDVQVKTADSSDWVPASMNMPLLDGDAVWVPDGSRAAVQLREGTVVRLDENSSLEILSLGDDTFQFYLSLGHAYVNFRGRRGILLQMDSPASSTRAFGKAKFGVDVADNGFTDVSVFKGSVSTEGGNGRIKVTAGDILSIGGDTYAELAPLGPADEWERWNREMDERMDRRYASSTYLPSELSSYSADFEDNGRWVSTSEYGYVWTPTMVAVDWAPYRLGRWTWIGGEYVWVSYDPWGWTPYHYGRWAYIASIGWCWVPPVRGDVYWGPGYVGWVNTGSYLAWVPLAPGEIYYGHGQYGRYSVNITNININTINVSNVYKNVYVTNGITVVSKDAFISGRPSHVDASVITGIKENNFLVRKIEVGRPQIAPTKASYLPVVKSIAASKEPPQAIRQIQVSKLKENRPIVKNPSQSVMKPGVSLNPMTVTTLKEPKRPGAGLQAPGLQPKKTGREIKQPGGVTQEREIKMPGGAMPESEVKRPVEKAAPEVKKPVEKAVPEVKRPIEKAMPEVKRPVEKATPEVKKPAGEAVKQGSQPKIQQKGKESEQEQTGGQNVK